MGYLVWQAFLSERDWLVADIFLKRLKAKMNNRKKYKLTFILIAVIFLSSCDTKLRNGDVETVCSEPRPEVCTQEYVPVCGFRSDGASKTYSNKCTACAEEEIIGYKNGECS